MNKNNKLLAIMKLAIAINNQNEEDAGLALITLEGINFSDEEKSSLNSYEDTLINLASEKEEIFSFLKLSIFENQSVFASEYVISLVELNQPIVSVEVLNKYLNSNINFDDPYRQYRYCYALSSRAILTGNADVIEQAVEKIHQFNSSQPDFVEIVNNSSVNE
jgi:hypothetical protein